MARKKTISETKIDLAAVEQYAALGYTDTDIALVLGVQRSCVAKWKKKYYEFDEILKRGKLRADAVILNALYKKAKDGDVTAQIFWMKNRQPEKWRDRHPGDAKDNPINLHLAIVKLINGLEGGEAPQLPEGQRRQKV